RGAGRSTAPQAGGCWRSASDRDRARPGLPVQRAVPLTRSLRSRLVVSAAGFAALFVLAPVPALEREFDQTLEQVVQQRLAADASTLIGAASVDDGELVMPEQMPDAQYNLPEAKLLGYVYDAGGSVIWHSRATTDEELHYLRFYAGNRNDLLRIRDRHGNEYYVYDVEVQLSGERT